MRIRVVTLNVWALPWPITRDGPARMLAIGNALEALDADLVAFQEVWTRGARDTLLSAGSKLGYQHVWHRPEARGGSGLLMLSRLPIESARFTAFRSRGLPQRVQHSDYYGGKGFVILRLATEGGPIAVLSSHLHARYAADPNDDEYVPHRTAQVIELSAALREVDLPLIALGDFNVRDFEPEYEVLLGISGLRDAASELDAKQPTVLAHNGYRGGGHLGDERIDYVFSRDGAQLGLQAVEVERVFDQALQIDGRDAAYSDHVGLLTEFETVAARDLRALSANAISLAREIIERGREQARGRRSHQRGFAAAAGSGALLSLVAARSLPEPRRSILLGLMGIAAFGALGGGTLLALSEAFVPDELAAFDYAREQLDALSADAS